MTVYKQLCAELVDDLELCDWPHKLKETIRADIDRARAALAQPEPPHRCIYSPSQIAECGGPCQQGPEHCDCGELWITEPEPERPTDEELESFLVDVAAEHGDIYWAKPLVLARAVLARWGK